MTYMFILKCALKLVPKNILYYDARSEKHKKKTSNYFIHVLCFLFKLLYNENCCDPLKTVTVLV